jgi:ELWxxDGT repeat protein
MKTLTCLVLLLTVCHLSGPVHLVYGVERSAIVASRVTDESYFLGHVNGELYFIKEGHLWKTDGTVAGTYLLTEATPIRAYGGICPAQIDAMAGAANGLIFLSAGESVHGQELWRSDGTPGGTFMAKDINMSGSSFPRRFTDVDGTMFFEADGTCCGIWRSDGTDAGTVFLPNQSVPLGRVNGLFVFERNGELWAGDASPNGTALLSVLNSTGTSGSHSLISNNGKVYFVAFGESPQSSQLLTLWATDGTIEGTRPLIDLAHFVAGMTCHAEQCYVFVDASDAVELWRTDGTPNGTSVIAEVSDIGTKEIVDVNGTIYFTTNHGFWKTDGTTQGTGPLLDAGPSWISSLTHADGALFFVVRESGSIHARHRLWRSDGTSGGTVAISDLGEGAPFVTVLNGTLVVGVWGAIVQGNPFDIVSFWEWQIYKIDATRGEMVKVADLVREDVNCPTPLCSCSIPTPRSIVVGDKWFLQVVDAATLMTQLSVISNVYFRDVKPDYWAFPWVERLAAAGLTSGCGEEAYCPEDAVTRAQMAVFLLRGKHGSSYVPPAASGGVFADVPASFWASAWIEQLAREGITAGCDAGNYCPGSAVTRAQLAPLLLRAEHDAGYLPPAASGEVFADVPADGWASSWIEQLAREGITAGCSARDYCPESPVTRAQLAVFLSRAFDLRSVSVSPSPVSAIRASTARPR